MDPLSAAEQVFAGLAALKAAVDTAAANREAAEALARQARRTGNRLRTAVAMGLDSAYPPLRENLLSSLAEVDDALYAACKAVFRHFLATP